MADRLSKGMTSMADQQRQGAQASGHASAAAEASVPEQKRQVATTDHIIIVANSYAADLRRIIAGGERAAASISFEVSERSAWGARDCSAACRLEGTGRPNSIIEQGVRAAWPRFGALPRKRGEAAAARSQHLAAGLWKT